MKKAKRKPKIGLVLGSGGARGLAHIVALETLDRLKLKPAHIAGTSIGAILGACYASGVTGAELRAHVLRDYRNRTDVMTRLFQTRVGRFMEMFQNGLNNPVLVDAEGILERFLPRPLPQRFEELSIPLSVVAADFHRLDRVVFTEGPLHAPVAASMAIPGLVRPVVFANRVMVDGGAVDPLPVRAIPSDVDFIIAVDVSRAAAREESERMPNAVETGFRVFDLMQAALADAQAAENTRPIYRLKAPVEGFAALDFFSAKGILAASEGLAGAVEAIIAQAG